MRAVPERRSTSRSCSKTPIGAAVAVHNAGRLLADQGQYDEAKMCFEQAHLLNLWAGSAVGQAADLGALAGVAHSMGDRDRARELHEQALETLLEYEEIRAAVCTLADLATLAQEDGRLDEAAGHLDQAERLAISADDLRSLYDLHVMRGDLFTRLGDIAAAESEYLRAVDAAETPRAWLLDETEAIAYFDASRLRAHDRLVRLAVEHSCPGVAFEHSERARSREMVRRLAHLRLPPARHAPAELVAEEAAAFENTLWLLQELTGDDAAEPATAHRYEQTKRHWQGLLDRIARYDEQYVALRRGDRVTLVQVRTVLAEQHPRALLVEYYVADHRHACDVAGAARPPRPCCSLRPGYDSPPTSTSRRRRSVRPSSPTRTWSASRANALQHCARPHSSQVGLGTGRTPVARSTRTRSSGRRSS